MDPIELRQHLNEIKEILRGSQSLLKLGILSAGGSLPTTLIGNNFIGDTIGTTDNYVELYKNNYQRLVALKVVAEFVVPGATASISLTSDRSNNGRIDLLSSAGKVISDTIWVKPNETIYINTADTAFSLNGSVFRVLIFDPLAFAGFLGGGI
jgi:hypothetical protein